MPTRTLTRMLSLKEKIEDSLASYPDDLLVLFSRYIDHGKGMLQRHEIIAEFESFTKDGAKEEVKNGAFGDVLRASQEGIVLPPVVALAVRPRPGVWDYISINVNDLTFQSLAVPDYMKLKEQLVDGWVWIMIIKIQSLIID